MNIRILTCLMVLLGAAAPVPVFAGDAAALAAFKTQMREMNKLDPAQNQAYLKPEQFFNYKIQDNTSRSIGKVDDLLINDTGRIETIVAEFNALTLRGQPVFLDNKPTSITVRSGAYQLPFHRDDLEAQMPEMLANIASAAGEDGTLSVRSLTGRNIVTGPNNRRVATVKSAIIDQNARRVIGLLLTGLAGTSRSGTIAVPYTRDIEVDRGNARKNLRVSEELASAMETFSKAK